MLYAAQDQAPSIEGKEAPYVDKEIQTHRQRKTHSQTHTYVPPFWASPE